MTARCACPRSSLLVLATAALAAGGAAHAGEVPLAAWERVEAADDPVGYVRFLESHPRFAKRAEVEARLAAANRRAVAAGAMIDFSLMALEPVGPAAYRGEARGPDGIVPVTFTLQFEGELSLGTGGAAKRNFGSGNPARLVPGVEGEPEQGSWASLPAGESRPVLAVVWRPGGYLPPAEVYVAGAPILHFTLASSPAGGGAGGPPEIEPVQPGEDAEFAAFDEPPVPIKIFGTEYPEGARQARGRARTMAPIMATRRSRETASKGSR